ncbi:MAG: epoxide hydrolase [Myxococcales bacterium]|nr:epoxide hydrolase [Myxococcales bacterium]
MSAKPFVIDIADEKLADLDRRLANVNWAADPNNDDWRYGANVDYLRELVEYWRNDYDWREREKVIGAHPHYRANVDGLPIHFIHERGVGPSPVPLILTHGWPWTFWDFQRVIGPLVDPAAHGGDPVDAFDVVVPSLPGYAFSTPIARKGIYWATTADLWVELMTQVLGYEGFFAHGGDWGALVTMQLGHKYKDRVRGIHLTNAFPMPAFDADRPWAMGDISGRFAEPEERGQVLAFERKFASHVAVHMLDPQSLAIALHDSPVGLAAWIVERRRAWGDCRGDVESRFSKQHLIDTLMLYWLTDSFTSSVRFYAEAADATWEPAHRRAPTVETPTGVSLFRHDMPPGAGSDWMDSFFDLRMKRVRESGGHFAAYEEPEAVVDDIREVFRPLR